MESWVNDTVAGSNCGHAGSVKSHTDILDDISGGEGKISHLLGVDLLGLGYDRDVSVIDRGVEKGKETECQSCAHFRILVLCIDEVDLIMG